MTSTEPVLRLLSGRAGPRDSFRSSALESDDALELRHKSARTKKRTCSSGGSLLDALAEVCFDTEPQPRIPGPSSFPQTWVIATQHYGWWILFFDGKFFQVQVRTQKGSLRVNSSLASAAFFRQNALFSGCKAERKRAKDRARRRAPRGFGRKGRPHLNQPLFINMGVFPCKSDDSKLNPGTAPPPLPLINKG